MPEEPQPIPARIVEATPSAIADAARRLRDGELVAFPTETVYGLGAIASDKRAVARVFAAKGRPRFNPLIVHVADAVMVERLAHLDERARAAMGRFWPGPLTLVLRRRSDSRLSLLVSAGLDTVAVRCPDHPVARSLIDACAAPIAAPSANVSGRLSPTTAQDVAQDLGDGVALILDGGACRVGVESSIVDLSQEPPRLLRPGGIACEALAEVFGPLGGAAGGTPRAPGMLRRHYAPSRPLRLAATQPKPGEALLGFAEHPLEAVLDLSPAGDLEEAAANLFAMLRALDAAPGFTAIGVAPIPEVGLGRAINDRLRRAAAPPDEADAWNDERGLALPCALPDGEDDDPAG